MPTPATFRVVIADDVAALRRLVRLAIEEGGRFRVVGEAGDGAEAIRVAESTAPDLILLDLSMPRMDGLEALPRIRAAAPAAKVVMFSGFTADRMGPVTAALGAAHYVEKGAAPERLVGELLAVLGDPAGAIVPPSPGGHGA